MYMNCCNFEKNLWEKWKDLNITLGEGDHELLSINCITVQVGAVKYSQIPGPREIGSKLISALSVSLPEAIPCSDVHISTRKKLELKQKSMKTRSLQKILCFNFHGTPFSI